MVTKSRIMTVGAYFVLVAIILGALFTFGMPNSEGGEEVRLNGPVVRFQPTTESFGVTVFDQDGRTGFYGFRFDDHELIPGMLLQPTSVEVYSIPTKEDPRIRRYVLRMGSAGPDDPPDHVVLTKLVTNVKDEFLEFWVGPLEPGLTQVLFQ